jgi:hypothetical protein
MENWLLKLAEVRSVDKDNAPTESQQAKSQAGAAQPVRKKRTKSGR